MSEYITLKKASASEIAELNDGDVMGVYVAAERVFRVDGYWLVDEEVGDTVYLPTDDGPMAIVRALAESDPTYVEPGSQGAPDKHRCRHCDGDNSPGEWLAESPMREQDHESGCRWLQARKLVES